MTRGTPGPEAGSDGPSWRSAASAGWLVALVAALLVGVAAGTSPVPLDAAAWSALVALYASLASSLVGAALLAARAGRAGAAAAGLVLGAVLAWHVREQTRFPESALGFAALTTAAALLAPVLRQAARAVRWRSVALLAGVSALAFAVALVAVYRGSEVLRWRILRHNKLVGTPLHLLVGPRVAAARERVFARLERRGEPRLAALEPAPSTRRSLVFVLVDTLRADALSAWGGAPEQMPRLERLASRSWRFLDVMANASWTRPSVASFFTGLLPEEHGALDRGDVLSEGQRTLAERLQDAGFSTAAFVSNHAAVGRAAGFAQGFDAFHELEGRPYARAEAVSRAVVAALGQGGCPAPCFLYVHYLDPHVPYLSGGPPRGPSPSSGRAAYARELRSVDDGVASLLAGVRRHLGEQTPVLVTSDHGEEFGEHGEAGHGHSLYAEQVRLPMLLHLPGTAGGDLGARLEARDFFDLAVRLALGPPARDVSAWAEGRARRLRYASTYLTTPFSAHRPYLATVAMRRIDVGDLAMIWSGYGPTRELYAIGSDPGETVNLAADRGERLEELERELDAAPRWLARSPPAQPTEAQLEQLRALGYVR